jgi:hypothetical protein
MKSKGSVDMAYSDFKGSRAQPGDPKLGKNPNTGLRNFMAYMGWTAIAIVVFTFIIGAIGYYWNLF